MKRPGFIRVMNVLEPRPAFSSSHNVNVKVLESLAGRVGGEPTAR